MAGPVQDLIKKPLLYQTWRVHHSSYKRPPPLPIPSDLQESHHGRWLELNPPSETEFLEAFERKVNIQPWIDVFPIHSLTETELSLNRFEALEIISYVDGWCCRSLLESSSRRWAVEQDERTYAKETCRMVERIFELVKGAQEWDNVLESSIWPSLAKIGMVAERARYWQYQELCLIRHELWERFHWRREEVIRRYEGGILAWQRCWNTSYNQLISDRIQTIWTQA